MTSEDAETRGQVPVGIRRMWLLGEFLGSTRRARLSSFYELLFGLLVGTLPFWLGGIVILATGQHTDMIHGDWWLAKLWSAAQLTFEKGELLIFAVSLIGPAFWLATNDPEGGGPLPHRRPIMAATFVVVVVCSVLFGLIQAGVIVDRTYVNPLSFYFTLVSIFFMYLALTYHYFRLPQVDLNEQELLRDQTDLLAEVKRRRTGK
jgi:hypothetical protein